MGSPSVGGAVLLLKAPEMCQTAWGDLLGPKTGPEQQPLVGVAEKLEGATFAANIGAQIMST